jgi:aryl-alcohol dehydrogenase-like predicted oxidoreductase
MEIRPFGSTTLRVSELGLGCARIGGIFQKDSASFVDILAAAKDHGIRFFDTADMYSQGESETLVGRAFRKRRDQVVIATKAGYVLPAQRRMIARIKPFVRPLIRLLKIRRDQLPAAVRGTIEQNFSPAYLRSALEASLRRLKTDYVDLLQLHSPPADIIERGEWASALEDLKRAGKVRYYGISVDTLPAAEAALKFSGISSLQVVVSLLEQGAAASVLPRAKALGVGVIARECLANGLLVKEAGDLDLGSYTSSPEQLELRKEQLTGYRQAALSRGIPLSRLALEYVTKQEGVSVSLIGVRTMEQLKSLLHAHAG